MAVPWRDMGGSPTPSKDWGNGIAHCLFRTITLGQLHLDNANLSIDALDGTVQRFESPAQFLKAEEEFVCHRAGWITEDNASARFQVFAQKPV